MSKITGDNDFVLDVSEASSGPLFAKTFDFNVLWRRVNTVCNNIMGWKNLPNFTGQEAIKEMVEAYTLVYRLVSAPCLDCPKLVRGSGGEEDVGGSCQEGTQALVVYYLLRETISKHLQSNVAPRLRESLKESPETLLETYLDEWKTFIVGVNGLRMVFYYLHGPWQKFGLPPEHPLLSTEAVALLQWVEIVMNKEFTIVLGSEIFSYVRGDRNEKLDEDICNLIREIVNSFAMLSDSKHIFYTTLVEEPYTGLLTSYYTKSAEKFKKAGMRAYVHGATVIFQEEEDRVSRLLGKKAIRFMMDRLAEVLINGELLFLRQHLSDWILNSKSSDLNMLCRLMTKSDSGVEAMKESLSSCALERGIEEINRICEEDSKSNENVYRAGLKAIILVYKEFKKIMSSFEDNEDSFKYKEVFLKAVYTGLESALLSNKYIKVEEMLGEELARMANERIKNCKTIEECEDAISEIVILLKLIPQKNQFLDLYPKYLSGRLLFDSYNEEHERLALSTISRSKESTSDFVHKCEIMLRDVTERSLKLYKDFNLTQTKESQDNYEWEFQPIVLTSYSWPDISYGTSLPTPSILIPKMTEFKSFFSQVLPKRCLIFVSRFSRGTIKMILPSGSRIPSIDISIGQSQLLLCECFNIKTKWNLDALLEKMEIKNHEIVLRAINAFSTHGILEVYDENNNKVEHPLRTVLPKVYVVIGSSPDMKKRRINLFFSEWEGNFQVVTGNPTEFVNDPLDTTNQVMDQAKVPAIQATVIRIFKKSGTLSFTELVELVNEESNPKFLPSVQQIKVTLEFLISRGFIGRNDSSEGTFSYIS